MPYGIRINVCELQKEISVRVIQQVDFSKIRIEWMMLPLPSPSFIGMLLDVLARILLLLQVFTKRFSPLPDA